MLTQLQVPMAHITMSPTGRGERADTRYTHAGHVTAIPTLVLSCFIFIYTYTQSCACKLIHLLLHTN